MSVGPLKQPVTTSTSALRGWIGHIFVLTGLTALANLPFWLVGHWYFLHRPVISLDLLFAVTVMAARRNIGLLLLAGLWLLDGLVSQSFTFHFQSPLEMLRSARFAQTLNLSGFLSMTMVWILLLFGACLTLLLRCTDRRAIGFGPALTLTVGLALTDILNGSSLLSFRDTQVIAANITGSPVASLVASGIVGNGPQRVEALPAGLAPASGAEVLRWTQDHSDSSVLYVIVESWGLARSAAMRQWLSDQMLLPGLERDYEVHERAIAFKGATTAGELRSLCGLGGSYAAMTAALGEACLPAKLAHAGWQTIGLHGFSGRMFDRRAWWPMLGLQQISFVEDLDAARAPQCGAAFRGVCDERLIERAAAQARQGRRFVYALTLNSHLPLRDEAVPPALRALCIKESYGEAPCQLVASIGRVMQALGRELQRSPQRFALVVAGDHAPPFGLLAHRMLFSSTQVPETVLFPRQGANPSKP